MTAAAEGSNPTKTASAGIRSCSPSPASMTSPGRGAAGAHSGRRGGSVRGGAPMFSTNLAYANAPAPQRVRQLVFGSLDGPPD